MGVIQWVATVLVALRFGVGGLYLPFFAFVVHSAYICFLYPFVISGSNVGVVITYTLLN